MKKILIFLAILEVVVISALLIIRNNETKVEFKYEPLYLGTEPTFKFTAISKHFTLATGEAYYKDEENLNYQREILITNFKMNKEIKNLKTYSLEVRFYDRLIVNNETHYQGAKDIKNFLNETRITYGGDYYGWMSDPFIQSKEYEFKDNLKISIKYCLTNDLCYEEKLKIKYID